MGGAPVYGRWMRQTPCAILSGVSAAGAVAASPRRRRGCAARPDLARFLRDRYGPAMWLSNIVGAIDAYVLLVWVLPTPDQSKILGRDTIVFFVFVALTGPIGRTASMWLSR